MRNILVVVTCVGLPSDTAWGVLDFYILIVKEGKVEICNDVQCFNHETLSQLSSFLYTSPRYKLVFVRNPESLDNVPSVDLGFELASFIHDNESPDYLPFIKNLISKQTFLHPSLGKVVYLRNLGILFEPELGLDVSLLLSNLSKNTLLLLDWNGQIKYPYIYFLHSGSKHRIKIDNLNYIAL